MKYCYFCRKFKPSVRRLRLRFGELYVCPACAQELMDVLDDLLTETGLQAAREIVEAQIRVEAAQR